MAAADEKCHSSSSGLAHYDDGTFGGKKVTKYVCNACTWAKVHIFHANIPLNKTFISRRPVDGPGCCGLFGLFGQFALLRAKEKYVQVLKNRMVMCRELLNTRY